MGYCGMRTNIRPRTCIFCGKTGPRTRAGQNKQGVFLYAHRPCLDKDSARVRRTQKEAEAVSRLWVTQGRTSDGLRCLHCGATADKVMGCAVGGCPLGSDT